VGSLRWLVAGANRRLRNLKPEQLPLLLLRAALLAALAGAGAGPGWRQPVPAGRGQLLLSPAVAGAPAVAVLRPRLDSLRRRGYALRWLAPGFPLISTGMERADSLGNERAWQPPAGAVGSDWLRAQQAAGVFPGQPLVVVAAAALRRLQSSHAPLPAAVTWLPVPVAVPTSWLQAAAVRADSMRLIVGRSRETQTSFRLLSVRKPPPGAVLRVAGLPPLRFEIVADSGRLVPVRAHSPGPPMPPIPVRTRPLRVLVYATAAYASEARYLQAALRAAAVGLPEPLELRVTSQPPIPNATPDWLFWLADAPRPATWNPAVRRGMRVWQEAAGPGTADTARLATPFPPVGPAVTILRREAHALPAAPADQALWQDAWGRPVLTRHALGKGATYRLVTRLAPSWSGLADAGELPAWLLPLLQPDLDDDLASKTELDNASATHDQRTLDLHQLSPAASPQSGSYSQTAAAPATFRTTDLRPALVLLAGLLFLLERLLARRRDEQAHPSTA